MQCPSDRPRLAITLGDCAGIGPELVLRALLSPDVAAICRLRVYGCQRVLRRVADRCGLNLPDSLDVVPSEKPSPSTEGHQLIDDTFAEADTLMPGRVQAACGRQSFAWIQAAVRAVQGGLAEGIVTAPVSKEAMRLAGVPFPGHTEILAHLTGAQDPCMAFHADGLFVSLATIHEALADVPRLLTVPRLARTIRLTHEACRRFGKLTPKIGVLALNPHAGEHGLFGDEESRVIGPAIAQARSEGLDVCGPLVPDTSFTWLGSRPKRPPFDAYVAMYHDQGLIPFKMAAFDTGVNVTLGLPIVRTSPDHGTAFDIAWQGKASPESLFSAIRLAASLTRAPAR